MNFNFANSSYLSSSNEDDEEYKRIITNFHQQNQNLYQIAMSNNNILSQINSNVEPTRGGSVVGHRVVHHDREAADHNLFNDYFVDNSTYNESMFRRQFRMSRSLFIQIVDVVKDHDEYFGQRMDATGRLGLSTLQKVTTTFRILAYVTAADATDEYIKIGESIAIECVKRFCRAIVELFSEKYLRSPTDDDVARLLRIGEQRGFPGMLGSLDCMHWTWKSCPTAWARQYAGRSASPTIILEVVADYDQWIWDAYFCMPGSNNDINVLERSHIFSNLTRGIAPPANYVIQGKEYNTGYYLADGIYPKWSTLVQTIRDPRTPKTKYFAMKQEACRKDVECAFGVLQSRFAIVANPARFWMTSDLQDIMTACIIMHNMIIEDERDLTAPIVEAREVPTPEVEMINNGNSSFQDFLNRRRQIRNADAHFELRNALIEHLWVEFSNLEN